MLVIIPKVVILSDHVPTFPQRESHLTYMRLSIPYEVQVTTVFFPFTIVCNEYTVSRPAISREGLGPQKVGPWAMKEGGIVVAIA